MSYQKPNFWQGPFRNLFLTGQVSPKEAIQLQKQLKKKIILRKSFRRVDRIAGVDVSFSRKNNRICAAVVVVSFPELKVIDSVRQKGIVKFPYIPGLLTFREGPIIISALNKLKTKPDVIIFDGQGIAHPRRMGIATHLGILLDKPTVGCAKSLLWGKFSEPANKKGVYSSLFDSKTGEVIGAVVRTRKDVKPVFVSSGYKIDLNSAVKLILTCSPKFRIPQPLRLAHQLSKI